MDNTTNLRGQTFLYTKEKYSIKVLFQKKRTLHASLSCNILYPAQESITKQNKRKYSKTTHRHFRKYEKCPEYSIPPFRFRALIPKHIVFNSELTMDIIWLNKKSVLYIVDKPKKFQNAIFIKVKTAESLWTDFVNCREIVYNGFPEARILDQESSFTYVK